MGVRVEQLDHVEVFVPHRQQAAEWYGRVLGLEPLAALAHWAEEATGPLMLSSDDGATKLALFRGEPGGPDVGYRRVAFRVDAEGFRLFLESLETLGMRTADGERVRVEDVVDHGESLSIYFADPWGNRLEVTTYDPDARGGANR